MGGGITYAKGWVESAYGRIVSDWKIQNGEFIINITVPVGSECQLILLGGESRDLKNGNYTFRQQIW